METIPTRLAAYFSFEGSCPRGEFWRRQLTLHLVFGAMAFLYLCCSVLMGAFGDALVMLLLGLFYLFSFPCGVLTLALWVAIVFIGLMLCPPGYTPALAPEELQPLLYSVMLLASVVMFALVMRNWALSARRLRDAGIQEGWAMAPLLPVLGHVVLMALLCRRSRPED